MNQELYSKRELDLIFKELKDMLERIEKQTMATNGRVKNLEMWKAYIAGAIAVLSVIVVPMLMYILKVIMKI